MILLALISRTDNFLIATALLSPLSLCFAVSVRTCSHRIKIYFHFSLIIYYSIPLFNDPLIFLMLAQLIILPLVSLFSLFFPVTGVCQSICQSVRCTFLIHLSHFTSSNERNVASCCSRYVRNLSWHNQTFISLSLSLKHTLACTHTEHAVHSLLRLLRGVWSSDQIYHRSFSAILKFSPRSCLYT